MATPNYKYEKRQKALAKKKKQDEKRQRRLARESPPSQDDLERPPEPGQKEQSACCPLRFKQRCIIGRTEMPEWLGYYRDFEAW